MIEIADEFAEGGGVMRDQADALATKNDLNLLGSRLETAIEHAQKALVMWFAAIMVVHATAVVALTVGFVKLL